MTNKYAFLLMLFIMLPLTACDNDESVGEQVEGAAEEVSDGVEDAAEELQDRTTGEKIGDTIEDAGEDIQDAAEEEE